MINLPINLSSLSLTDTHKGALTCKKDILAIMRSFYEIDCGDIDGNIIPEILLEKRSRLICEIVNKLGDLNDFQKGYISTLLEIVEMTHDGCEDSLKRWLPCLVTGKWQ